MCDNHACSRRVWWIEKESSLKFKWVLKLCWRRYKLRQLGIGCMLDNLGYISSSIYKMVKRTCLTTIARNLNKTHLKGETWGKKFKIIVRLSLKIRLPQEENMLSLESIVGIVYNVHAALHCWEFKLKKFVALHCENFKWMRVQSVANEIDLVMNLACFQSSFDMKDLTHLKSRMEKGRLMRKNNMKGKIEILCQNHG